MIKLVSSNLLLTLKPKKFIKQITKIFSNKHIFYRFLLSKKTSKKRSNINLNSCFHVKFNKNDKKVCTNH